MQLSTYKYIITTNRVEIGKMTIITQFRNYRITPILEKVKLKNLESTIYLEIRNFGEIFLPCF